MAYTRDQIYAAMRNADKAGDADAVRALAAQLQGLDSGPDPQAAAQAAMAAFRGMAPGSVPQGAGQGAGAAAALRVAPARMQAAINRQVTGALPSPGNFLGMNNSQLVNGGLGVVSGIDNLAHLGSDVINRSVYGSKEGRSLNAQDYATRENAFNAARDYAGVAPNPGAETAGQIASAFLLPGPKLPKGGGFINGGIKGLTRAIQGGLGGAMVRDANQESLLPNVGVGAVANAVLPPIASRILSTAPVRAIGNVIGDAAEHIPGIGNAIGTIRGKMIPPALLPPPAQTANIPALAPQMEMLSPFGRGAQARAARYAAVGFDSPTTAMVTRDPAAWTFEQNAMKGPHGAPLVGASQAADRSLGGAVRNVTSRFGGVPSAEAGGQAVQKVLDARSKALQDEVGGLYTAIRTERGNVSAGQLPGLRQFMNNEDFAANTKFDDMRASLTRRLQGANLINNRGQIVRNGAMVNVSQAEGIRKFINTLGNGADPDVLRVRSALTNALDEDVIGTAGGDAFAQARAAARSRFEEFKNTFVGSVAGDKIPPQRLANVLMQPGTRLSDVRNVRQSLEASPNGRQALDGLRAMAVQNTFGPSISPEGAVSGKAMYDNFQTNAPMLRNLLEPADYRSLRRIAQAAFDAKAQPPYASPNYSNTAPELARMFQVANPPKSAPAGFSRIARDAVAGSLGGAVGGAVGGPVGAAAAGNTAIIAREMLADRAAKAAAARYAAQMTQQVGTALDPMAAAAQARMLPSDEVLRLMRERFANGLGRTPMIGALSGAAMKQRR